MDEVRSDSHALDFRDDPRAVGARREWLVARNTLLQRIDEARASGTGLWLAARAGAGKTTLVHTYAEARGVPLATCTSRGLDAEPAVFFQVVARVAERP